MSTYQFQQELAPTHRRLKKDEIIEATDECFNDHTKQWEASRHCVGKPAPDPAYTAHRSYRRPLVDCPGRQAYKNR